MGHTYKIFKRKKVDKRQRNINIQWSMLWIIILLTDRNKGNPYRFQTGDTFFFLCIASASPNSNTVITLFHDPLTAQICKVKWQFIMLCSETALQAARELKVAAQTAAWGTLGLSGKLNWIASDEPCVGMYLRLQLTTRGPNKPLVTLKLHIGFGVIYMLIYTLARFFGKKKSLWI